MRHRPYVCLTDEECARLIEVGYSKSTVYQWQTQARRPFKQHLREICKILRRDVTQETQEEGLQDLPPVPEEADVTITAPAITLSACDHDELCIPVRRIAHVGNPGTILDQRKNIPCTNCKRGIERERKAAARKVNHGLVCECGEAKSYDSRRCRECEHERRKAV